jgi:hypothetical protein
VSLVGSVFYELMKEAEISLLAAKTSQRRRWTARSETSASAPRHAEMTRLTLVGLYDYQRDRFMTLNPAPIILEIPKSHKTYENGE